MNSKERQKFHVGQLVVSPSGMARIVAFDDGGANATIRVVGSEQRKGDIIAMLDDDENVVPVGDIHRVNGDGTCAVRTLNPPLPVGTKVFNLSRDVRIQLQAEFGQRYTKQTAGRMSPEDSELIASLGIQSADEMSDEEIEMYKE